MTLDVYYLTSLSIAATLFCIVLIVWTILGVWVAIRLSRILNKLDQLTETTGAVAHEVKQFVHSTTERFLAVEKAFFTAQGIKQIAGYVVDVFQQKRNPDKKGDPDGRSKA